MTPSGPRWGATTTHCQESGSGLGYPGLPTYRWNEPWALHPTGAICQLAHCRPWNLPWFSSWFLLWAGCFGRSQSQRLERLDRGQFLWTQPPAVSQLSGFSPWRFPSPPLHPSPLLHPSPRRHRLQPLHRLPHALWCRLCHWQRRGDLTPERGWIGNGDRMRWGPKVPSTWRKMLKHVATMTVKITKQLCLVYFPQLVHHPSSQRWIGHIQTCFMRRFVALGTTKCGKPNKDTIPKSPETAWNRLSSKDWGYMPCDFIQSPCSPKHHLGFSPFLLPKVIVSSQWIPSSRAGFGFGHLSASNRTGVGVPSEQCLGGRWPLQEPTDWRYLPYNTVYKAYVFGYTGTRGPW